MIAQMKNFALLVLFCVVATGNASAQLYKTVSESGKVMYSDQPPQARLSNVTVMQSAAAQAVARGTSDEASGSGAARRASAVSAPAVASLHSVDRGGSTAKLVRVDIEIHGEPSKSALGLGSAQPSSARKVGMQAAMR